MKVYSFTFELSDCVWRHSYITIRGELSMNEYHTPTDEAGVALMSSLIAFTDGN